MKMKKLLLAILMLIAPTCMILFALPLSAPVAATNPHGRFQGDCMACHDSESWKPIRLQDDFDHSDFGFPLRGAHSTLFCGFCHVDLEFSTPGADCSDCHLDIHQGELGLDCERCHDSQSFNDGTKWRQIHREVGFPLAGGHLGVDCAECHANGAAVGAPYRLLGAECLNCHVADFERATDPPHDGVGFSSDCAACHRLADWNGARFSHAIVLAEGIECVSCHRADYDATNNPDHGQIGFPVDCQACHDTRDWGNGQFDHDQQYFPIYSGKHMERWNRCSQCHSQPSNYSVFSCFSCHPHSDRAKTNESHSEVDNYSYDSLACLSCHAQGRN